MPKISDERRAQRRAQYLDAARLCISRQGIAGTRMEDITAEAGLSSGSTYLYFATKDELIRAAIDTSMRSFEVCIQEACSRAGSSLHELLDAVVAATAQFGTAATARFSTETPEIDLYRLAIQGWAFAQTDEPAAALLRGSFDRLLGILEDAVAPRLEADVSPSPAREIARALASIVISGVLQRALFGELDGVQQLQEVEVLVSALTHEQAFRAGPGAGEEAGADSSARQSQR